MTENPTIPSTPGPSQPPSLTNSTTPEDASGEIDCICEISDDDGFTICCDKCDKWQHIVCIQLDRDNLPEDYICFKCSPNSSHSMDVQKAKDFQRQRREEEQAKRSHKKKRPAGTSHKRRELANGTNGITSGKISSSTEKTGMQGPGKSVSPKEMQQPSRKKGHRVSAQPNNNAGLNPSVAHHTILINAPNAKVPPETPSARNGETESDTDPEKPTRHLSEGFTDLGNSPNKYTSADVQRFLSLVMPVSSPDAPNPLEQHVYLNRQELASPGLPKASPNGNGNSRKQRRTNASTESMVSSKRPSPDRQSVPLKKEEDEESRSVSPPLSRGKPRSRDLTPSMLQDVAVEQGEMTGREARKFKEVLSRIEKQQQEEQQPQTAKRRKRNSTVSLTPGTSSLHNMGIDTRDCIKVADSRSGPNHGSVEYSVTDAGVGRRPSDSPVSSDERIARRTASYSPVGQLAQGSDTLKHAIKTIVSPVRPQYEDRAIQTDPIEEEIPWWSPAAVKAPPRPPRLPLRKRLMQSLLRDREEAAAAVLEDKKRKLGAVSQDPENMPSPKIPRLSNSESARGTTVSSSLDAKGSLDVLLPPHTQDKQSSEKTRLNLPQDKPRVNGYRNSSLQVQLPSGLGAVNGPSTPTPQCSLPSAPHSASISYNYVNLSGSALNSNMVSPSPTKTRKISLEDYGKRRHRSDPVEKSDEKSSVKATNDGPTTWTNLSKPSMVPLMEESTNIADPTSSMLPIATAPPPPATNSSKLVMEPVGVPPTPKDQRMASLSSSVR
ncbi:hypothetical protein B9Z19DRAFT_991377 [Tuber borchii]|uniref:Zinc finger PHD-type domain-containing protein n=1 Tax=Tuber borchii TaxID=42251 RepID=A0A2T6ZL38_TUBBO|nr:hypothetical protein B9Z19DRAFT_991377 [Tuber borchii]